MGDPDRVGDLDLAAIGEPRGDDVLGHVAGRVGSRAVDLRGILAGERAAAVAGGAAVGVDDDLAARETGVADRPADHEAARRVDEEVILRVELALVVELRREDGMHDVLPEVGTDQGVGVHPVLVLSRDQDLLDLDRPPALVADRDLRLAVGAKVRHDIAASDLGEPVGELVRERDRQWHQLRRLARRVAEHHPLVAGPREVELIVVGGIGSRLQRLVDALGDVR